jgi:hypothetical protein
MTAGWILFVVWALAQMVWYRRAHVEAPAAQPQPPAPRRIPPRRPIAPVEAPPTVAAGPPVDTIDFPDIPEPPSIGGSVPGLS